MKWTIIADDLTGAGDSGVAFARRGWMTRVAFSAQADFGGAPVRVLTTELRGLAEDAAERAVERAARGLGLSASSWVYKKIDFTLRGHPGAELAAVMRATGIERALVTPAFPSQGREVRGGQVWVHGVRLAESEFAGSAGPSGLPGLFGRSVGCRWLSLADIRRGSEWTAAALQQPGVVVADAETDADLVVLVQAARRAGVRLLCGSAGLAHALAGTLPAGETAAAGAGRPAREPRSGPVLVVAGSRSPVTLRQVETARRAGVRVLFPKIGDLRVANEEHLEYEGLADKDHEYGYLADKDLEYEDLEYEDLADKDLAYENLAYENIKDEDLALREGEMGQAEPGNSSRMTAVAAGVLSRDENLILSAAETRLRPGAEARIAAGLASFTAAVLLSARVGGLVLTGGETAAAVFRALGCASFDLGGEVLPGVVWGRLADGPYAGLPVVTKAGGFGDEDTLLRATRFLV